VAQSLSLPHVDKQAVPPALQSRWAPQVWVVSDGQLPAPSQLAALVSVVPLQLCARHCVTG
jgi:hypothetical protein